MCTSISCREITVSAAFKNVRHLHLAPRQAYYTWASMTGLLPSSVPPISSSEPHFCCSYSTLGVESVVIPRSMVGQTSWSDGSEIFLKIETVAINVKDIQDRVFKKSNAFQGYIIIYVLFICIIFSFSLKHHFLKVFSSFRGTFLYGTSFGIIFTFIFRPKLLTAWCFDISQHYMLCCRKAGS